MKIVRLEPDRVRVFLSEGDLSDLKIDVDAITPDSPKLGMFLYHVLEVVKEETGFSEEDGQIIAEATPDSGGIVLELSHAKSLKKPPKPPRKDSVVFEIVGFDNLSGMLKNTSPVHLLNMRLYVLEGKFYVAVPRRRIPVIIYEYSLKNRKSPVFEAKVAEYGRLIAGGYRLMCMAAALKKIN